MDNKTKELLELILSLSNVIYLPTEKTKTDHLNKINRKIKEVYPELKEAI